MNPITGGHPIKKILFWVYLFAPFVKKKKMFEAFTYGMTIDDALISVFQYSIDNRNDVLKDPIQRLH